jgi:hypothetical protein
VAAGANSPAHESMSNPETPASSNAKIIEVVECVARQQV